MGPHAAMDGIASRSDSAQLSAQDAMSVQSPPLSPSSDVDPNGISTLKVDDEKHVGEHCSNGDAAGYSSTSQGHSTLTTKETVAPSGRHPSTQTMGTTHTSNSGNGSTKKRHKRSHKTVERLPFLRAPSRDSNGPWLKRTNSQSVWFALFYDLALVAVLTVFSGTHELSHPSAIPIFLSYFAILSWIWTSQCFYDIRYEADDVFHRMIKSCQIIAFIFIGAASGNWNLNTMRSPDKNPGWSIEDGAENLSCQESFRTITIAFAGSRGLLLLQYIVGKCHSALLCPADLSAMLLGRRSGRKIQPLIISTVSILLSLISLIIAATLPFESDPLIQAKVSLVYLPLIFEIIGTWLQLRNKWHHQVSTESVGERYGALTLVILGEGFISLTRAFSLAISGLSQRSTTTYAQVFLAIMIIIFTFLFLFGRFNKQDHIHHSRVVIWETIHFPLHFFLLLLLAAIVNFIVTLSFAQGIMTVSNQFQTVLQSFSQGGTISQTDVVGLENYIAKLQLYPPFEEALNRVKELNSTSPPTDDVVVILEQYAGQIILQTIRSYGIPISDEVFDLFAELQALNTTIDYSAANVSESLESNNERSAQLIFHMISIPANEALSGVLWLFPSAGAVLLFAAIRSMVWYRFAGIAHWVIHAPMLFSGVALCLLGFLDLGDPTVQVNANGTQHGDAPIIDLIYASLPLVIVTLVYLGTYYVSLFVMSCVQRTRGGVFANAHESSWIA